MLAPYKDYDFKNKKQYCLTLYRQIKRYCENPRSKFYFMFGGKGIQCQFTSALEIEYIYNRDGVDDMKEPYFVCKDRKGHFSKDNCQFLDREQYDDYRQKIYLEIMEGQKCPK